MASPSRRRLTASTSRTRSPAGSTSSTTKPTRAPSNRRLFVDLASGPGRPDGLAVDREGHVWSARWDGSAVYRYAPDGREVGRIEFAAKKITSVAFGGSALAELYVTSAGGDDRANEGPRPGPSSALASGTQGCPRAFSRIGI
ncbi:MAG: SMP-30/gluconolactonase/LRE family protein [Deltaproteobacteria bacterium]|nr:SMP-30/gluconolactonase/LRE family protein [Deltaproteobacteria bacterium]